MSVSQMCMWPIEPCGSILMNSIWFGSVSAGWTWLCPITPQAWKWPVSYMSLKLELPTSFSIFTVSDGLLNGCSDSSSQSMTQPTSAPFSAWCWNVRTTRSQISS